MQKEQDTQFRFTPQVAIILVGVFFAMMIPILCVVLGAQSYFQKPPPPVDPAAFAPLQKALEDVADKSFASKTSLQPDSVVKLRVIDPVETERKVVARVAALGGVAMRSDSAEEGVIHLLIQIPQNQVQIFSLSPTEAKSEEKASLRQVDDQARALVDVLIERKAE